MRRREKEMRKREEEGRAGQGCRPVLDFESNIIITMRLQCDNQIKSHMHACIINYTSYIV